VAYLLLGAVRVSLEERMPNFKMTSEEARALADYLSTVFVDDALSRRPRLTPRQPFAANGCSPTWDAARATP
jgi:hypothetical protein